MRKFTTHIYTKANYLLNRGRMALSNQRGDFYISDAVKIIIAVVLGALLLSALTSSSTIRSSPASLRRLKSVLLSTKSGASLQNFCSWPPFYF